MPEADDPPADLAQRAFGFCAALDLRAGRAELDDEVGVGHRGGGVVGEGTDERDFLVAERIGPARERAHRPERPPAADERGDEEGVDVEVADEPVGVGEVDERGIGRVVTGHDDLALGDGAAEHADAQVDPQRADPLTAAIVGDAGVGREAEDAGVLVEEVGHRAVGAEQARRLVDRAVEDRRRVERRGLGGARLGLPRLAAGLLRGRGRWRGRRGLALCGLRARAVVARGGLGLVRDGLGPTRGAVRALRSRGGAVRVGLRGRADRVARVVPFETGSAEPSAGSSAAGLVTGAGERRDRVVATGGGYPAPRSCRVFRSSERWARFGALRAFRRRSRTRLAVVDRVAHRRSQRSGSSQWRADHADDLKSSRGRLRGTAFRIIRTNRPRIGGPGRRVGVDRRTGSVR